MGAVVLASWLANAFEQANEITLAAESKYSVPNSVISILVVVVEL